MGVGRAPSGMGPSAAPLTVPVFSGRKLCLSPQLAAESLPQPDRVQVPKNIGEQGKNVPVAGVTRPLKGLAQVLTDLWPWLAQRGQTKVMELVWGKAGGNT